MYCSGCWIDHFFECSSCWDAVRYEDGLEGADGDYYCQDCWEDLFVACADCDDVINRDDAVELNDRLLCQSCANSYEEDNEEEEEI
jgi:formylmethanofuran dehydrogenase subunit E